MISNLWSTIHLYCANHETPVQMRPHEAATSRISQSMYGNSFNTFYACPKYYPDNREKDEPACRNHISINEFEKMLNHFSSIIEEYSKDGGTIDLTGEKWKSRAGVEYQVIKHTDETLDVLCLNKKSLH